MLLVKHLGEPCAGKSQARFDVEGTGEILFFTLLDKRTASAVAFGNLLENGEAFANRLIDAFKDNSNETLIESVASDGELYGHHHPHGDMTLAYCIYHIMSKGSAKLTNYAEFLEKFPAEYEVQIQENTSWSCVHGVERWRSDCGDNMGHQGWHQAWRKPLREAMDWLRDTLSQRFEQEASQYLKDSWDARNSYIDVLLDRSKENKEAYLTKHTKKQLTEAEKRRVFKLLEMQRHTMLMYTSCGWFFDEISGTETVQVIMYAARAMQLARELLGLDLEGEYTKILQQAPSNIAEFQNGEKVYNIFIKPAIVDFAKISAQNTIMELFADQIKAGVVTRKMPNCSFRISSEDIEKRDDGKFRLIVNRSTVYSSITLDEETCSCAAIWLGDHNVTCGAINNMQKQVFDTMRDSMLERFEKGQINEIIVMLSKYFGKNIYSLKDLFKDDQRRILDYVVAGGLKKAKELYGIIYHDNSALLRFMVETRVPSPKPLRSAAEIILNMETEDLLSAESPDLEKMQNLLADAKYISVTLDSELLALQASEKIANEFNKLSEAQENIEVLRTAIKLVRIVTELPIKLNLWQSQNTAFKIAEDQYKKMKEKNDEASKAWVSAFTELCGLIGIRLA